MLFIKSKIGRFFLLIALGQIFVYGCSKKSDPNAVKIPANPVVTNNGKQISFPADSPGLQRINTETMEKGRAMISVFAPARIVATISNAVSAKEKIVLFESSDIASLYSSYKQAAANVGLSSKNLERTKDMYKNLAATARDLNQAETDASNAKAAMAEMESRLRTSGFNPKELIETPSGTAWLVADVTETQLSEVDKGEAVDIYLDAFPDKKFDGKAVSVGDIVDPTTRTVKVRVTMKNFNGKLLPGMFGKIDFGDPKDNVLLIPLSAVFTVEGTDYVFIEKEPNVFIRQQVILGPQDKNKVIVQKGISNGDKVVVGGTMLLKGLSFNF
ncbi:MAG: efflux RND transporter periplasmic adaptor subunit [Bacteroidota bacterium]